MFRKYLPMMSRVGAKALTLTSCSVGLALSGIVSTVSAQAAATGSIQGRVSDASGNPVRNAEVRVLGTTIRSISDGYGIFLLRSVPSGNSSVVVSYLGYKPDTTRISVVQNETIQQNISLVELPLQLRGVSVQAQLSGQARALNQQRNSAHIQNVISEEQIDKFPNTSVSEALKRVGGVSFPGSEEISDGMHLRGLGPGFSSVTINGERVPSTGYTGERGTNTSMILSEMVESIEVNKAITPDMAADAVGGSVNLVMKSPREDRSALTFQLSAPHAVLSSRTGYDGSATWSGKLSNIRFLFSSSHVRDYRNEERLTMAWGNKKFSQGGEAFVPTRFSWADYDSENTRSFVNVTADIPVSDRTSFWLRSSFNHERSLSYSPWNEMKFDQFANANEVSRATVSSFSRYRDWNRQVMMLSAGGDHKLPGVNVDYRVSFSQARLGLPTYLQPDFASSTFSTSIDYSDTKSPAWRFLAGSHPSNGENYQLTRIRDFPRYSADEDMIGALNAEFPFSIGDGSGSIKAGLRHVRKSTWAQLKPIRWSRAAEAHLPLSEFAHDYKNDDHFDGIFSFFPAADGQKLMDRMKQSPSSFAEEEGYTASLEVEEYDAVEAVSAAYAMGTYNIGNFTLLGGARVERTAFENRGGELVYDSDGKYVGISDIFHERDYTGVYPNLHLKYRAGDNTTLRLAATTALARPQLYDMTPYSKVEEKSNSISKGNPDLAPSNSTNFDVLFEHYMQAVGILSLGAFYKDVNGFIVSRTFEETTGEYAGWQVTRPENGDGAQVYGFEAGWQQRLSFLPSILSDFGVYLNYTWTGSKAELAGGERTLKLPKAVPHVVNAALMYERGGTSGSLSVNYFSDYLESVGAREDLDLHYHSRTQLDLMLSRSIMKNASLYLEAANITNARFSLYQGESNFVTDQRLGGVTGRFGMRFSL